MIKTIGTVKGIIGEVFAVSPDGTHRLLTEGSRLYAGDTLETGPRGAVDVVLSNGQELTLGRGSSVVMDNHMLGNNATVHVDIHEAPAASFAQLSDVQRVQAAIQAGQDPTANAEPTAAGPAAPGNGQPGQGGGSHSFVMLNAVGGSVDPTIGFPTSGTGYAFQEPAPIITTLFAATAGAAAGGGTGTVIPPAPPVSPVPPVDHGVTISPVADLNVNEANLANGSTPDAALLTQTGSFTVSAPDGLATLTVGNINVLTSVGVPTATADGTLTIDSYDASTGKVTYSYTLDTHATQPAGNGTASSPETFTVVATDTDGNKATSSLTVNITDDVPHAADNHATVTATGVDTNVLIVLDVSNSMNDASGVNGLTRLELAKQAMGELLDKYSEQGDVRVQVVTFSSVTHTPSTVWVDVATAKSLVADITASGGTDYDLALAAAEKAVGDAGKIAGAQTVSYFLSDGNPTLSDTNPTTKTNPGNTTDENLGDGIDPTETAAWQAFLSANSINSYAIGLGGESVLKYLNPIAYNGAANTDADGVKVTDLNNLTGVLTGTVQGAPITGSLLTGGGYGADGGFIKAVIVDGTTYTFNPTANTLTATGGNDHYLFDATGESLSVSTSQGGTLVVNLTTGDYVYTPPKDTGTTTVNEHVGYVLGDNDGDLAAGNLTVTVTPNSAPVAVADHIITNVLDPSLNVPDGALVANDTDADGDVLSARPGVFNTGWSPKGSDFTATSAKVIDATSHSQQAIGVNRSSFFDNAAAMTAAVVVSGFLGKTASGESQDVISVSLKAGESLTLHQDQGSLIGMEYKLGTASNYAAIGNDGTFTATQDGVYQIHLSNVATGSETESYNLNMTVNYSGQLDPTTYNSSYTVTDGHGGTDVGAVTIAYQNSHTLTGTSGDDVIIGGGGDDTLIGGDGNDFLSGGAGNDVLLGGNGNDVLMGGAGNDILDGGAGNNTASYADAPSGVNVDLSLLVQQNTGGAGLDTLSHIQNLIGSSFNDTLKGDGNDNVLNGGAGDDQLYGGAGNDTLIGGLGNDTMTGGAGADTFKWQAGDKGHDTVTDFQAGVDHLDLSQLLKGEGGNAASLDDYLHFSVTGSGASAVSTISVSPVAGGATTQTIDLSGVDLASQYHVTAGAGGAISAGADTASIINGMLGDHSLKVDTV